MTTNIQKWGNSQGIRLPKSILDALNWSINEKIVIDMHEDHIVVKTAAPKKHKSIEELFENYNDEYVPEEIDWGTPTGKEIW